MKLLNKIGKSEPKGWEQPDGTQQHFPIIQQPNDENELPVPYYDSDDVDDESDCDETGDTYDTDYTSDSSATSVAQYRNIKTLKYMSCQQNFKTVVQADHNFLAE